MDSHTSEHPVIPDTRELPLNEEISRHAYDLWERYGRPDGRDVEIWLEAERQLLGADSRVNQHSGKAVLAKPLEESIYTPPAPGVSSTPAAVQPATAVGKRVNRR
jgi:hypothetical protein